MLIGCSSLQPGADPLVVNAERVETVGKSTFDLVLNLDNSNRPYWQSNAPAFHDFCQWLRQPQTIEQTNTLPRAAAMLLSLDDVKLDYQSARSSSNALVEALATFQGVLNQAQAWQTLHHLNQPLTMTLALALAQVLIPLLPTIETGVEQAISFIESVRTAAKQSGEWTQAMDYSFRSSLIALGKDPAYLP